MDQMISKGAAVRPTSREVRGYIVLSKADIQAWRDSDASKGMTDDGETKLPPKVRSVILDPERTYVVVKARATVTTGYSNPMGGMSLVLDATTGDMIYVKRNLLTVVG